MVNQKLIAESYCLFFIAVYVLYICYSVFGGYINEVSKAEVVPSTVAMNATMSATMAMSSFTGVSWLMTVVIVAIAAFIVFILSAILGQRSMAAAQ